MLTFLQGDGLGPRICWHWQLGVIFFALHSLLLSSPTLADRDIPDAAGRVPSDKETQALLQQGRQSSQKKDFAVAERLFLQALAKVPNNPDVLLELGWAQFQLGKLPEARKTTLAAMTRASRAGHYAASSYNLGRIEEAAGNERTASADYRRSLAWQTNKAQALVEREKALSKRLQGAPSQLLGPYQSIESMCPELTASEDRMRIDAANLDQNDHYECGDCEFQCYDDPLRRLTDGLPPPLEEVVLFLTHSRDKTPKEIRNHSGSDNYDEVFLNVAVRIKKDWYLAPALNPRPSWGRLDDVDLSAKPVGTQGARAVIIKFSANHGASNMFSDHDDHVCALGIGPSGKPSLLSPVLVSSNIGFYPYGEIRCLNETETTTLRKWKFDMGALVITSESVVERQCSKKTKSTRPLTERYPLNFP